MCDFVWIIKLWYHIDGTSIMRCIKYDDTEEICARFQCLNGCGKLALFGFKNVSNVNSSDITSLIQPLKHTCLCYIH